MEKEVKARKDHTCDCGKTINKGSKYLLSKLRVPTYDEFDCQIGVDFLTFKTCLDCPNQIKDCVPGYHVFENETKPDGYVGHFQVSIPTGRKVCINCRTIKEE